MRLFIGLDLPADVKTHIHQYLLPMQKSPKGWEHPHDYHQTLLFIGETTPTEQAAVEEKFDLIQFHPFVLTPDKFLFFNRRIMFLSFKESPELTELKNLIESRFPEWLRPESKPFIPHVTVKRWQRYEYEDLTSGLNRIHNIPPFWVNQVSLFKSLKDEENRKYHVIKTKRF
jgi:2'-5' RNA ligase